MKARNTYSKIVMLFFLIITGSTKTSLAQKGNQQTYLTGHIKGLKDTTTLTLDIIQNSFQTYLEWTTIVANVDSNGDFKIRLGVLSRPVKVNLKLRKADLEFGQLLVEPGDSVHIETIVKDRSVGNAHHSTFSGRGSDKYGAIQHLAMLPAIKDPTFNHVSMKVRNDLNFRLRNFDSTYRQGISELSKYKSEISNHASAIMKADLLGNASGFMIGWLTYKTIRPTEFNPEMVKNEFLKTKKVFTKFLPKEPLVIFYSKPLMVNMLALDQDEMFFQNGAKNYPLDSFVNFMIMKYVGRGNNLVEKKRSQVIFDNLMTYYFTSISRYGGPYILEIGAANYSEALRKTIQHVSVQTYKNFLTNKLKLTKGQPVYNFKLPLDTTNKLKSLADFRGKVVLLDVYSYNCGACYDFATAFHQKIFPQFKNEPKFAYVSVMSGDANLKQYKERLKNLNPDGSPDMEGVYTSPDYYNLRGCVGKPETQESAELQKYYNVFSAPFILLIDKKGRIYSSTVPFFQSAEDPNVEKLANLIKQAIAEKD